MTSKTESLNYRLIISLVVLAIGASALFFARGHAADGAISPAAAGDLDTSFNPVLERSVSNTLGVFDLAIQPDGKMIVAGSLPATASVTINDDATEPATNAIDDSQNFVCQHYHDFLGRQADTAGLNFWTSLITSCGSNPQCIEKARINVSASFFLAIEFQESGYLVERIYRAAFGSGSGISTVPTSHQLSVPIIRLNEFLLDAQEISRGVIVNQGNWQQSLENNKQTFLGAFVQRARFTSAFPGSMTAAEFVDSLNVNAGNPLSTGERNQLVADLTNNVKTRAQVLRAVAEDTDFVAAEFNRAFVLMQYFGYLRRNPDNAQDVDYTGYEFWLAKLNQFNGNYETAELVKAFITSIEYRQRFGQ